MAPEIEEERLVVEALRDLLDRVVAVSFDDVIYVPQTPAFLQAVLAIVPLQLLAYRIARLRGMNVDQPRNLAKTVTVE